MAVLTASVIVLAFATAFLNLGPFTPTRTSGSERAFPSQSTPAPADPAAPIVVNWTTKSEVNTAGFNLYRAESASGPFVQVNRELIPAANDPIAGASYVFTDTNVVAGVTYYYQLEDVDLNGTRTRYEKLISVTATAPAGTLGIPFPIAATGIASILLLVFGVILWQVRHR
jgi:hypothetical protein